MPSTIWDRLSENGDPAQLGQNNLESDLCQLQWSEDGPEEAEPEGEDTSEPEEEEEEPEEEEEEESEWPEDDGRPLSEPERQVPPTPEEIASPSYGFQTTTVLILALFIILGCVGLCLAPAILLAQQHLSPKVAPPHVRVATKDDVEAYSTNYGLFDAGSVSLLNRTGETLRVCPSHTWERPLAHLKVMTLPVCVVLGPYEDRAVSLRWSDLNLAWAIDCFGLYTYEETRSTAEKHEAHEALDRVAPCTKSPVVDVGDPPRPIPD